jgi:hypothetical protein
VKDEPPVSWQPISSDSVLYRQPCRHFHVTTISDDVPRGGVGR